MGNGSAHSNTVDVQECVIMKPAYTHRIIQLTDFYYLVINYNYILIDKIYKNMAVTSSVVKYTMKTIQNLLHAVLAKFTILCPPPHAHRVQFSTYFHTPIKYVMVQVVPNSARNVKRPT